MKAISAATPSASVAVPALDAGGLAATFALVALTALFSLRRRTAKTR